MIFYIITAFSVVSVSGLLLLWRGEALLDYIIEVQKRYKGGYYKKINPNEKCPSCGACEGLIFYNTKIQRVVHSCQVCHAPWTELPRIPVTAWDFVGRDLKLAGEQESDIEEVLHRANSFMKFGTDKSQKPDEVAN